MACRSRAGFDLEILAIVSDERFNYGEPRFRAYGLLGGQPYCLVFTIRDDAYRRSACGVPTQRS
jgi:uncharacterized DUF497 family protein